MALKIYAAANSSSDFSIDGAFSNPMALSFNGSAGGVLVKKYYLRNDDIAKYYTAITIAPYVASGQDITSGANGFSWKLIAGSSQPLEQEWALVTPGNTLSMNQIGTDIIGDNTTYYPLWLRISVPANTFVQAFENVKLRITYTENLVTV